MCSDEEEREQEEKLGGRKGDAHTQVFAFRMNPVYRSMTVIFRAISHHPVYIGIDTPCVVRIGSGYKCYSEMARFDDFREKKAKQSLHSQQQQRAGAHSLHFIAHYLTTGPELLHLAFIRCNSRRRK